MAESSGARGRLAALLIGVSAAALAAWFVAPRLRSDAPAQLEFFEPEDENLTAAALAEADSWPSRTGLVRLRLDEAQVGRVFSLDQPHVRYEPHTWFAYLPNLDLTRPWPDGSGRWPLRTNSLGMREDSDPAATAPDLRVLVAGDSHTDGVCPNSQSFPNLAEAALGARFPGRSVECLNAARGGYTLYQYLGTLERFADLAPDVFVVAVYGGNDFGEALGLRNFFEMKLRRSGSKAYRERIERAKVAEPELFGQALLSTAYFAEFPKRMERAASTCGDVLREIAAVCAERATRPVLVYVPSVLATQPDSVEQLDEVLELLELDRSALSSENELAEELLAIASELGIATLDFRAEFAAAEEPLYWRSEWHMKPAAHARIAARLEPLLADELAAR